MAYNNGYRGYGNGYNRSYNKNTRSKSNTYTEAEKIAFKLGQEQRVLTTINSQNKHTRVYDSYLKGLNYNFTNDKKPLFDN